MVSAFILALPLVPCHLFMGVCLHRLARCTGSGPAWWAWVPGLNLALSARFAGRSPAWCLLFLVPPLNLLVWGLLWAEACDRMRRPAWLAAPMCVPVLNLAVLAHLAGLAPARAAAALLLALMVSVPAAVAAHTGRVRARVEAARRGLEEPDPAARQRAAAALARTSTPRAVPGLAAALADPDEDVRAEAARGLETLGAYAAGAEEALIGALGDGSGRVRGRAARALWAATDGRPAGVTPDALLRALLESARETGDDEIPDGWLVRALAGFGPSATPQLVEALSAAEPRIRWHAAAALMQLGRGARPAAPALRRAMDDAEWPVRNAAGRAIEEVADAETVASLTKALQDPSPETRYHAARALGRVGPRSAPAVPVLTAALRDPDWEVRMESAWALAAVGPAAAAAAPELLAALRDPDPQVRASAAWGLSGIGAAKASAAPALRQLRADEDRQVREAAAGALARIEGRAP